MAYCVFFALIVAFLSGAYATDVKCNQNPHPAMIGGMVNVTCTGPHKKLSENLEWKLPDGTEIDGVPGVVDMKIQNTRTMAKATLTLNLTDFPTERTVSCGLNDVSANYTICVSWSIIHSPRNVTVHGAGDSNVKMTCAIVQDCTISPNPWFSHDGVQVENSEVKGIHVNRKSVDGTKATVVEWELAFTNLSQKEIFSNYTCRASPSIAAIARLEKADDNPGDDSSAIAPTSSCAQQTVISVAPCNTALANPGTSLLPTPLFSGIHQLVNVTYQSPDSNDMESVHIKTIGSTVNVSCITNCSSNGTVTLVDVYPLSWPGDNRGAVLTVNDIGVVNISSIEKSNNSASRMLQLRASVINGTKWPKPFKCAAKVRLPDGDEFIRYGKTFSVDFTIPLNITTVPPSGKPLKVTLGKACQISCIATGDDAPTDNPWLRSGKTKVESDTEAGVTVTTVHVTLQNTKGINSTITFTKVSKSKNQLGDYICSAGDGKPNATVTLKEAVPLNITTVPPSGKPLKVTLGKACQISCIATGDEAPTDNPWLHSGKTKVESDTKAGVTVTTVHVTLQNTKGINSTITFKNVTKEQLGVYMCHAGDGKHDATVTLMKEAVTSKDHEATEPTSTASPGQGSVGIAAVAVAIVVVLVIVGVVSMAYWKRHMLRDWLMEKDVVKVMKKGKRGKGYKYSKLPKDISTSMKHLE